MPQFVVSSSNASTAARVAVPCGKGLSSPSLRIGVRSVPTPGARFQPPSRVSCRALVSSNDTSTEEEAGADPLSSNPAFAAVLQAALQRQGPSALTSGPQAREEPRRSAAEEVLHTSLQESRRKILQLEQMQKVVEDMLVREKRQFDRLHFALKKAGDDFAYSRSLQKIIDQMEK